MNRLRALAEAARLHLRPFGRDQIAAAASIRGMLIRSPSCRFRRRTKVELIVGAFAQGASRGAEFLEMSEDIAPAVRQAAPLDTSLRFGERRFLQTYLCLHVGGGASFRNGRRDDSHIVAPSAERSSALDRWTRRSDRPFEGRRGCVLHGPRRIGEDGPGPPSVTPSRSFPGA